MPPVRMLDVFGPAEVFTDANRLRSGEPAYEVEIISAAEDRIVASHVGTPLLTDRTYRELCNPIDTLLVGGGDSPQEMRCSVDFLGWLRKQSARVRRLGSICTGALVLADAGLLNGRRATTHWKWCGELVRAFTDAMRRKDLEAMLTHMADDVTLETPLVAEPFKGKAAVRPVVEALLGIVDRFDFLEMMQGPQHVSQYFGVTVGQDELDGMDYWLLDEAGLIREMTVLWRPLPAVVAVQNKLDRAEGKAA